MSGDPRRLQNVNCLSLFWYFLAFLLGGAFTHWESTSVFTVFVYLLNFKNKTNPKTKVLHWNRCILGTCVFVFVFWICRNYQKLNNFENLSCSVWVYSQWVYWGAHISTYCIHKVVICIYIYIDIHIHTLSHGAHTSAWLPCHMSVLGLLMLTCLGRHLEQSPRSHSIYYPPPGSKPRNLMWVALGA
jgi:hypothetical protein